MPQVAEDANMGPLQALSESIAAIVESVGRSTVAVRGRGRHALGCAVAWRAGVLVTSAHVFGRAPAAVSVVAAGSEASDAALVGTNAATDLAVFRISGAGLPPAEVSDAGHARAGTLAILVGRSQGGDLTASVTSVNRVSGAWETWLGGRIDRLIRLDGSLHDGQSGAPVADCTGRVFGIATSALSRAQGIVVPESTVSRVVDELLAHGHVARAFLGIGAQSVRVSDAQAAAGDAAAGLLITSVLPGGPAARAGLLIGDIVIDVAQRRAASVPELREALAGNIGKPVRVSLLRGGAPAQLDVTVGQWPAQTRAC